MKTEKRNIEFTAVKIGANVNFKVDVKIKESFLTRITNLFKSEKTVTLWLTEPQASSTSNYIFNEIKKLRKTFVASTDETVFIKEKPSRAKTPSEKVVAEGPLKSAKPKRNYNRKPRKEKSVEADK